MRKTKIALALSDLVVYTKSQKFVSFDHSLQHQQCFENNSIGESYARRLLKGSGNLFCVNQLKNHSNIFAMVHCLSIGRVKIL